MKKNNSYLADDEIDLGDIIKSLGREKILILSISIICGLLAYFYGFLRSQELRTEITLKDPPIQIFEPYSLLNFYNNNNNNNNISGQFISNFKLNFLSLDNVHNFLEESREFDNFKKYLKSRNISIEQYFSHQKNFSHHKISEAKERNIIVPNKYLLNHSKELDGGFFLNKYVEFVKKKTIHDTKNNLKMMLLNAINDHQEALEIAKKIQLENPIIKTSNPQIITEPHALFYKGTKVISENLNYLNKRLIKLENDQFNYDIILQKALTFKNSINLPLHFVFGLTLGSFLSLVIIYLKNILK